MPAIDIDRDAAHEAVRRELAKPIYPKASFSQRFHDLVNELLKRLLRTSEVLPSGWLSIIALLIVLAVAVALAVRVLRRTIRTDRGARHPLFDAVALSAAHIAPPPSSMRRRATGPPRYDIGCAQSPANRSKVVSSIRSPAAPPASWPSTPAIAFRICTTGSPKQQPFSTMSPMAPYRAPRPGTT